MIEAVFPVTIGDSAGIRLILARRSVGRTGKRKFEVGTSLGFTGKKGLRGGNIKVALVGGGDRVRIVASPVNDVLINSLKDDERDGGVNSEGVSRGRGGVVLVGVGEDFGGVGTFGER